MQTKALEALAVLAYENSANITDILLLGGLDVLYTTADAHIASVTVQWAVCAVLYIIARDSSEGLMALRGSSRASEVATRANASHPDVKGVAYWTDAVLLKLSAL